MPGPRPNAPALVSMTTFFSAFPSSGAMSVLLWLTAMMSRPDSPECSRSLTSLTFSFEIVCQKWPTMPPIPAPAAPPATTAATPTGGATMAQRCPEHRAAPAKMLAGAVVPL